MPLWDSAQSVNALREIAENKAGSMSAAARNERWLVPGICLFLAATVLIVFGQTLGFGFINYDDNGNIYENSDVSKGLSLEGVAWAFTHTQLDHWDPLTTLSHMVDCQLYGLHPWGHHLGNVLLHVTAVVLLFLALLKMTASMWRSAFVAMLWAIHPLRVESVAWVTERKDVLSGVFFMLALLAYGGYARHPKSRLRYCAVAALFILGLLSKSMVATLPFVFLLLDYWPLRRFNPRLGIEGWRTARRLFMEKVPLLFITAIFAVVQLVAARHQMIPLEKASLAQRVGDALVTYAAYLRQTVWPVDMTVFYPHPAGGAWALQLVWAEIVLGAVSAGVILGRRRYPWLVTGWLWYLGILVPTIGFFRSYNYPENDRYTYLPQIGLLVAATWSVAELGRYLCCRPWVYSSLSGGLIAASMLVSWNQATYWRDSETLWRHALAVTERNGLAAYNVGLFDQQNGKLDSAIAHFRDATEFAPGNEDARKALGGALLQQGRVDEAITEAAAASRIEPGDATAHLDLAIALALKGQTKEAIQQYRKALEIKPDYGEAENNMAYLLATCPDAALRDGAQAVDLAQKANALASGTDAGVLDTLAAADAEEGHFPEAVAAAQQAIKLAGAQGNAALQNEAREHLKLFQASRPLRETR